jgi:2-C-methyl-D-erythritol 4-phosphate cytidylyltransferase
VSRNGAIITGAGSSSRMGNGKKKEYLLLDNIPVLAKSVNAFQESGLFSVLVLTVPHNHIEAVEELLHPFCRLDNIVLIEGGTTRQESVWKGLRALEQSNIEYVLIHDAARPWIPIDLIRAVLTATEKYGACIPVIDICDAIVETDREGFIVRHLPKTDTRGVQTPQGFRFPEIFQAHNTARQTAGQYYDDAQIILEAGKKVFTIPGIPINKKITFPHDLEET